MPVWSIKTSWSQCSSKQSRTDADEVTSALLTRTDTAAQDSSMSPIAHCHCSGEEA
jgi:hypothetical protein